MRLTEFSADSDLVDAYVFSANVALQLANGTVDQSVPLEPLRYKLRGDDHEKSYGFAVLEEGSSLGEDADLGDDPRPLAFAVLETTLVDNLTWANISVVPDAEAMPVPGEKVPTELRTAINEVLQAAERRAAETGRTTVQVWATAARVPWAPSVTDQVLNQRGYRVRHSEAAGRFVLPGLSDQEVAHWENSCDLDVQWLTYDGIIPPDESVVDSVLELYNASNEDVPHGELIAMDTRWDRARLEHGQAKIEKLGHQALITLAVVDGEAVGISEVWNYAGTDEHVLDQGLTFVARLARGHGLGKALKAQAIWGAQRRWPRARSLYTSVAGVNEQMNAINFALGMHVAFTEVCWAKQL